MQRISDLVWMTRGVAKIGQAFAQSACDGISHQLRTSSIAQPLAEKLDEVCKNKSGSQLKDEDYSYSTKSEDYSFTDSVEERSDESEPSSNDHSSTPGNDKASDFTSKRFYSTSTCIQLHKANFNSNPRRYIHKTPFYNALTAEELATLAKVKKARQSKTPSEDFKPNIQNLHAESKEKKVPSSRIGRIGSFGGLAAGLAMGAISEYTKKSLGFNGNNNSTSGSIPPILSEANLARIVNTLCTVRGAALKLGQMLSIQDSAVVDPKLLEVFDRVRQSADFMPASQMKTVLAQEFGPDWRNKVKEFDEKPFAAASIGQVHRAVLHDGSQVAMKIQYPGVADSIDSDINNLVTLLKFWKVFPEQLFIDKFIDVAREELTLECDYVREADFSEKFRKALDDEEIYGVPKVVPELSGKRVLTSELIHGIPIDQVINLNQDDRNFIAAAILRLVLREIFEFRCMQTDPNWSNFFYDEQHQKVWLLDFGASRFYSKEFVDDYIEVVKGASTGDRQKVLEKSRKLGFLTGYETKVMEEAHIDATMIVGEPFSTDDVFDFSTQSTSNRIVKLVPTFLKHRLTAPPEETYSLHRKLSGAFLIATKLKAQFACKAMFDVIYDNYWSENAESKAQF